ncbi:hypothetical protein YC2023_026714 [Brassica napus]
MLMPFAKCTSLTARNMLFRTYSNRIFQYVSAAPLSQYAVSSIDGSSQIRFYNLLPFPSSQELPCKSVVSLVLIATITSLRLHYIMPSQASTVLHSATLSSELQSSTEALGLQVKLLYGSLLSLATSILRYVLIVSVYLFTVEDHSGCNRLSPWGV